MPRELSFEVIGQRYKTASPDTLDLAERARLGVHGMMGSVDPELLTMYGLVFYATPRPHQSHWASAQTTCDPKFGESLAMLRAMCGSEEMRDFEARYFGEMIARVQDGLYWDLATPKRPWRNLYTPQFYTEGRDEDFCPPGGTGRMIRTLTAWRALSGSDRFEGHIRALVRGLARIAVKKDDYAYYPEKGGWGEPCAYPRSGWLNTEEAGGETEGGEGSIVCFHGHQIYGAMQWHEASGDKDALELASRLSRYVMLPKFWGGSPGPFDPKGMPGHVASRLPDPPYTAGAQVGRWYSHFHARAIALRGLLEYGRGTGDERVLEFVRRAYEFTLTQGIARLGWINCWPGSKFLADKCESCALGDLVAMGIRLSDAGLGDYWDDVDACVRNALAEQQATDGAKLQRIAEHSTEQSWEERGKAFPGKLSYDDTVARTLGVYFGAARPHSVPDPWVMHCCTGNAAQGLYYAWEGAVREKGNTAEVNLLLNRASRLLDVHSHLPYEGKVEIRNKGARRIWVRMPSWADRRTLRLAIDGVACEPDTVGNGVIFQRLGGSETIRIMFAVWESTATYTVAANTPQEHGFTCTFRAGTCVDISPKDEVSTSYRLYERAHMRRDTAPIVERERFTAERIMKNW